VREVRNDFAHQLAVESFDQLQPRRIDAMRERVKEFALPNGKSWLVGDENPRRLFEIVTLHATSGLHMFEANLRAVRRMISTPEFESQMRNANEREFFCCDGRAPR